MLNSPTKSLVWVLLAACLGLCDGLALLASNRHQSPGLPQQHFHGKLACTLRADQTTTHRPTLYEINRRYRLRGNEARPITDGNAKGRIGVIFDLDTALVNIERLAGYSYAILAGDLGFTTPSPVKIRDSLGSTVRDTLLTVGFDTEEGQLMAVEQRLHTVMGTIIDKLPILIRPGAYRLVQEVLEDGNDVVVLSSLPLAVAKRIMGKSGLASLFEVRVPGEHFLCQDPTSDAQYTSGDRYYTQQLVESCEVMRKPPLLCTVVSGNHRLILTAKRSGFNTIAMTGQSARALVRYVS